MSIFAAATSTTSSTIPRPRLQPISFFSMGSSGSAAIFRISSAMRGWPPGFGSFCMSPPWRSARERRLHAAEEHPGDHETHPDDEPEEADHVDRRELADPLLPELPEVG